MDHIYIDIINDEPVNTLKSSQTKAPKDVPAGAPTRSQDSHRTTRRTVLIFAIFIVVGFLVGSLISGLAVYFSLEDNNTSICVWSSWTSWTDCSSTCYKGIQHRVKVQFDTDNECRHNEIFDNKTCFMNQCEGYNLEFSMTYDSATLHLDRYISDDNTILSSHSTQETPNSPDGPNQLQQYEGAITDICTDVDTIIYYTVAYNYDITSLLNSTWLILEVGLAERERVDNDYYVGGTTVNGWSFHLANCVTFNKICIWAQHRRVIKLKTHISDNIVGTNVNGKLGVVIDRVRDEFTLVINNEIVYTFQNVTSDVQLCPVFGVYNPDWVKTKLQISNFYNFTNVLLFR